MRICTPIVFAACSVLAAGASAQAPAEPSPADLLRERAEAAATEPMQLLQGSADQLRQSIQALAQQAPARERDAAIDRAKEALLQTQQAMLALQAGTQGAGTSPSAPAGTLLALVPSQPAAGGQLANGCWVRFYEDKNFRGPSLTLVGPVDMPDMDAAIGLWRDWDSAVAGPRATVTTYDADNYGQRTATLRSGQSVPDLRDQHLGWHEQVKSARVACTA